MSNLALSIWCSDPNPYEVARKNLSLQDHGPKRRLITKIWKLNYCWVFEYQTSLVFQTSTVIIIHGFIAKFAITCSYQYFNSNEKSAFKFGRLVTCKVSMKLNFVVNKVLK